MGAETELGVNLEPGDGPGRSAHSDQTRGRGRGGGCDGVTSLPLMSQPPMMETWSIGGETPDTCTQGSVGPRSRGVTPLGGHNGQ